MKTRLLVSYHEIRVSQPVTGENGRLLGFTREYPDRSGQFCMECNRQEWSELQRFRWASPIIENGFLVPDVDFVAHDGTVFQDSAECLAHERALKFPAWLRAIEDKRHGTPSDLCGNHERVGWLHVDLVELDSEETLLGIIAGFEHLVASELRDFETQLVLFGTHPAFEFMQVPDEATVDFYALPKYEVSPQDGQVVKSSGSYPENEGANPSAATTAHSNTEAKPQVGETVNAPGFEPGITGSTPVPAANVPDSTPIPSGLAMHKDKSLYAAAWDLLEAPMRLGQLATALGVIPETLKTALQDPLSAVELGHAGWVKRREPK